MRGVLRRWAAALATLVIASAPLAALAAAPIAFVPLDDRPVTRQLPAMLGRIAGREVIEPPRALLGNFIDPGDPDAIIAWLNGAPAREASDFVLSTDMLAYGGLVASRIPGTTYADAYFRLREIAHLHAEHPRAFIQAFGTVMRLAPTGVAAIGPAANFFAAGKVSEWIARYASLHDPPLPSEAAESARLRALIGAPTLGAYLDTRARNLNVDLLIARLVQSGAIDRVVFGQDDAGVVGLHVADERRLRAAVVQYGIGGRSPQRVSIEPGTDELGMAMVARALARGIGWTPHIAVRYSMPDGEETHDPLEFAPIGVTIGELIDLCGGVRDDTNPQIVLFVRVPGTDAAHDAALLAAMRAATGAGSSVAFADLTFLEGNFTSQERFARTLLASGIGGKIDAYSSWNTDANTVGTALAEAIAAGVGRRAGSYDPIAHAEFTFDRYVDDYAFHVYVRPELNAALARQGITDHTYLLPQQAAPLAALNSAALWNRAAQILPQLYPTYHIAAMRITLPWNRTFETEIDVRLAPALP